MKNRMKYGGLMLLLYMLTACNHTKQKQDTKEIFCKEDTTEVVMLATEYLEHLKNKEFNEAIQMIYHIEGDSVLKLTTNEQEDLMKQYEYFPVLSYKIESIFLSGIHSTEIMYNIKFFEKQEGDERPNTLKFRLNPKRINNAWYLGVLNR